MIEYDISGVKLEKYEWDSSCTILFVQNVKKLLPFGSFLVLIKSILNNLLILYDKV